VGDLAIERLIEHAGEHRVAGERAECGCTDECLRARCQDDVYVRPQMSELAGDVGRFIGGDAACDTQCNAFA
jgi:hypothetical protein